MSCAHTEDSRIPRPKALIAVQAEPLILATVLNNAFSSLPLAGSSAALAEAAPFFVLELHDLAAFFLCPQ